MAEKQIPCVTKIVSGGQTGADRGGLDAAIALGIPYGGWCPKGRRAEDGVIPSVYVLAESESADYRVRTERNVVDSHATLIFTRGPLDGGSLLTAKCAQKHCKPFLHLDLASIDRHAAVAGLLAWFKGLQQPLVLNVAGQRESKSPGLQAQVRDIVIAALRDSFTSR